MVIEAQTCPATQFRFVKKSAGCSKHGPLYGSVTSKLNEFVNNIIVPELESAFEEAVQKIHEKLTDPSDSDE